MLSNSSFLSVRGGYFLDNYNDTGIPNTTNYIYQTSIGRPGRRPGRACRGPIGTQNTPRALIVDKDATNRGFFNARLQQRVPRRRLPHAQGRLRLPEHGQRRAAGLPGRLRRTSSGTGLRCASRVPTGGRGTYGYYEVNNRGVQGEAGADIMSLYVQDQWTLGDRLTLNVGLRTEDETVPSFREGVDAMELRLAATRSRRASAPPTTSAATAGSRSTAAGAATTTGPSTSCRAAPTVATRGRSTTAALDTLDLGSLNLSNMPGADLWVRAGQLPRSPRAELRLDRPGHQADVPGQHQHRHRVPDRLRHGRSARTTSTTTSARTIEDIGAVDAAGQRDLHHRQPR